MILLHGAEVKTFRFKIMAIMIRFIDVTMIILRVIRKVMHLETFKFNGLIQCF